MMITRDIGALGEKLAARYLRRNGFRILEKNLHVSHNEIDIIAINKEFIIFAEVKTRSVDAEMCQMSFGTPAAAVTRSKQTRLISAAKGYLSGISNKRIASRQPRMDVIEIYLDRSNGKLLKINHITDAFGAY